MSAPIAGPDPTIESQLEAFLDREEASPKEPTAEPQKEESTPAEAQPEDTPAPEPEETETPAEAEAETPEEPTEQEPEAGEIHTFEDLAKAFDVEPETLASHLKLAGPTGEEVTLSDVLTAYRSAPEITRRLADLDSQTALLEQGKTELEKDQTARREEHDKALGQVQLLTDSLLREIENEPEVDWKQLEEDDPVEYLKLKNKRQERREAVRASLQTMQAEAAKRDSEAEKLRGDFVAEEAQKLLQAVPEWRDQEKATAAIGKIEGFLVKQGFTPQELTDELVDHRMIIVAHKAALYDEMQSKLSLTKNRVREAPPLPMKATARREESDEARDKRKRDMARLRKTGDVKDAARLIEDLV